MRIEPDITHPDPLTYRTRNRSLAAALLALGFHLRQVETGDRPTSFLFDASEPLLDAADAYAIGALSVPAHRMAFAMDRLNELAAEPNTPGEVDLNAL